MPRYEITSPTGERFEITAPDGASEQDVLSFAQSQWKAKPAPEKYTTTGSFGENMLAGAGKAVVDTGRGLRQLGSNVPGLNQLDTFDPTKVQAEVDEAKRLDKQLEGTWGGKVGDVAGQVAMTMLPAGALSKLSSAPKLAALGKALTSPATYKAAAAGGAALGFLRPVASDESRAANTALGAFGSAAGLAAGRAAQAGYEGVKSMVKPFTEGGREQIAGDLIRRAAGGNANAAMQSAASAPQYVPGSNPTLAEASDDAGIAALQLAMQSDPAVKSALAKQSGENTAARLKALGDVAGDDAMMKTATNAREQNAKALYDQAFTEQPQDSPWIKGEFTKLMQRPAFRDAVAQAQQLAANSGIKFDPKKGIFDPNRQVEMAHYTKLALDDMIGSAEGNLKRALIDTKDKFLGVLESDKFAPSYYAARMQYQADSQPINQMEVGRYLKDKLTPAITDFMEGAPTRTRPQEFAQAIRNGEATVRGATGRNGTLESVLDPEQLAKITGVAKDVARSARAQDLAKTTGSTTAQNLVTKNIVRQIAGPLGAPETFAESAFVAPFLRGANLAYSGAEEKTREVLAKALMEPKYASALMGKAVNNMTPAQLAARAELAKLLQASGAWGSAGLLVNAQQ
jgi:hypothetical protein